MTSRIRFRRFALSKHFDILLGGRFPREIDKRGEVVIRGRDLATNPLRREHLEKFRYPEKRHAAKTSQTGDILLQRIGDRSRSILVDGDLSGCYDRRYVVHFSAERDER